MRYGYCYLRGVKLNEGGTKYEFVQQKEKVDCQKV